MDAPWGSGRSGDAFGVPILEPARSRAEDAPDAGAGGVLRAPALSRGVSRGPYPARAAHRGLSGPALSGLRARCVHPAGQSAARPAGAGGRASRRRPARPVEDEPIVWTEPAAEVLAAPTVPAPDVEIEWDEPSPPPRPRPAAPPPPKPPPALRPASEGKTRRPRPQPQPAEPDLAETVPDDGTALPVRAGPSLSVRLREYRVPLAILGVVVLVLGTVGGRLWNEGIEQLPRIAREGRGRPGGAGGNPLRSGPAEAGSGRPRPGTTARPRRGDGPPGGARGGRLGRPGRPRPRGDRRPGRHEARQRRPGLTRSIRAAPSSSTMPSRTSPPPG